jgi:inorganic pyrophosphatase
MAKASVEKVDIVIETPKGSQNKYKYDPKKKIFKLNKVLPSGFTFPYDFGFIPDTKGDDGDPLDIMLISQQTTFPGCHIDARIIGGIKATQKEKNGTTVRNDRFFALPVEDKVFEAINEMSDLPKEMIKEIINFFVAYRKYEDSEFKAESLLTAKEVKKLIDKS